MEKLIIHYNLLSAIFIKARTHDKNEGICTLKKDGKMQAFIIA